MNGIFVAVRVMNCMVTSSGRWAMGSTASPACMTSGPDQAAVYAVFTIV